jgi:hypothetical protein
MAAAGIVMIFAPFVDWGKFLPNSPTNVAKKQKLSFLMEPRQTS